jgi:transcriptional regulator with XRE-family HTH domain
MTPVAMIARAVQKERSRAGMSLSALAAQAGLAKSTLSQLEAGQGNPSVETLWAIASALNIPFSCLFETPQTELTVIRADEGLLLSSEVSAFSATLLAKCPPASQRDLYRVQLQKGSVKKSDAHPPGTIEYALVSSGRVRLGPEGATEEIGPGDYFRYPGDVSHSYEALSDCAVLLLVMESPR